MFIAVCLDLVRLRLALVEETGLWAMRRLRPSIAARMRRMALSNHSFIRLTASFSRLLSVTGT